MVRQNKSLFVSMVLVLITLFSLSSCNSDNDPALPAAPVVHLTELGSGNNKIGNIGSDLHIDAEIQAEGLIQRIEIEIHQEGGGNYEITKEYTEGKYIGVRQIDFHEHIDIPSDAPAGEYHFHFSVTDQNGQVTTVESELQLVATSPSAALIFTEVTGPYAHGNHFHDINDNNTEGESITVTFDEDGNAISNGHLHLDPEAVYRIELKTYDANGEETQNNRFIANKATADNYKAFLLGGNFILNPDTDNEEGAIFQPREQQYADGSAVNGQYETTGILTYFTIGHENEDLDADVTFVIRKLNAGIKPTISRVDWNRTDYASAFAGENVLELKFEIHAEHGHGH